MATPGRVQVPELNLRPSLNPAPVVNVQPVAPVNRQGAGSNLINIAESLSGLSNSFARFAASQRSMKPEQDKQDGYLAGSLSGRTYEDLNTYFKANPDLLKKEKVALMYAGKAANQYGLDLQSGKLTEDWDGTTPLEEHLAKKQSEYGAGLGDDPMMQAYYNETANQYTMNYRAGRSKAEADAQATENVGLLSSAVDNAIEGSKAATGAAESAPGVAKRLPIITGSQPGRQPLQLKGMQGVVLDRWEQVQGAFGKQLSIVSGYRDEKTNGKAGGAKKSQHLHGNALDIDISGLSGEEKRKLVSIASGMGFTGIGFGENSLHLDMRKGKATWGYGPGGSMPAWAASANMKHVSGAYGKMAYSVNASAVAVDEVFASVADSPQFKALLPNQRTDFWYNKIAALPANTEDDLKLIEGLLTSPRPDGVPPIIEDPNYAVKARALIEQRKEEFRQNNIDGQSAVNLQVTEAINNAAGLAELRRIREGAGNLLPDTYWMQADEQMRKAEIELEQKQTARNAHNAGVDSARAALKEKLAVGAAFGKVDDVQVPDPNTPGKTTTYSGEQLKKDVMNDTLNGLDKMAAEKGLPEEAKWGITAAIFSKTNETIPRWEEALSATPKSFNPAEAAAGVSDQMVQNAKLYDYLKGSGNYLYLDAHLKGDNTKQFWTMYDSFRGQGQSEREALFSTYKVMNDPGTMEIASKEVNYAEGQFYSNNRKSFINSELNGNTPAGAKVLKMATALTATGRSAEEALSQSIEMFKSTHEYVLNSWVPKNLKGLPENFTDNVQEYVTDYVTKYGAKVNPPISDVDDVMIAPDVSGSRFYLFQKSTGLPLMAKDVKGGLSRTGVLSVSLQTLRDFDKLKNDKAQIEGATNRAAMADAIAEVDGTESAPTVVNEPSLVNQGRGVVETERPATPQEVVKMNKEIDAKIVDFNIKHSERTNPNTLKIKAEKLAQLDEDRFKTYVEKMGGGTYLPEEKLLIRKEIVRRTGLTRIPDDVYKAAKQRWPKATNEELVIKLYLNGALTKKDK